MKTIDLHAHSAPPEYIAMCTSLGGSFEDRFVGYPDPIDMAARFEMMNEAGVEYQVLSPTCAPYSEDRQHARKAAQFINTYYDDLCAEYPDKFGYWLSVPLPDVEAALDLISDKMEDTNVHGLILGCFCLGESIADKKFEPIYEEMNRRKGTIFLHPCQNGIDSKPINDWGLTVCLGASLEDTLSVLHLIAANIPQRYPDIRFIVPHFGGILPTLLNRLDGQMPRAADAPAPSTVARGFFYDTVGWGSDAALVASVKAFGAGQIVTGSDFPILLNHESYKQTFDNVRLGGIDRDLSDQIIGNAARFIEKALVSE